VRVQRGQPNGEVFVNAVHQGGSPVDRIYLGANST